VPAAVELTRHWAGTLQGTPDGSVVNRYFVFHANVKKGTAKTTLAPTVQTHMPQPPRFRIPLSFHPSAQQSTTPLRRLSRHFLRVGPEPVRSPPGSCRPRQEGP
jgi:hypothetical protein